MLAVLLDGYSEEIQDGSLKKKSLCDTPSEQICVCFLFFAGYLLSKTIVFKLNVPVSFHMEYETQKCRVGPVKKLQVLKLFQTSLQWYGNLSSVKLLEYVF